MVWSAVDHNSLEIRRDALACTRRLSAAFPTEVGVLVKLALHQMLFGEKQAVTSSVTLEPSRHRAARLIAVLSSSANMASQPEAIKEGLVVDLLLISHHNDFGIQRAFAIESY